MGSHCHPNDFPLQSEWESNSSAVLLNDAIEPEKKRAINSLLPLTGAFSSHFWLATSGTTAKEGSAKWVALSKEAILASAQAVNNHFNCDSEDIWLHALPSFHIGGAAIWARAFISGAKVVTMHGENRGKWSAERFCTMAKAEKATLSALVPTQVYDLIKGSHKAPPSLRAIVVGGGALSAKKREEAALLGWKLFPSYGLTECSSQVATLPRGAKEKIEEEPFLQLLDHIKVKKGEGDRLIIRSPALLTAYGLINNNTLEIYDPKNEGWFATQDRVRIEGSKVKWLGRMDRYVKIGGESVDLSALQTMLTHWVKEQGCSGELLLFTYEDERLGSSIYLASDGEIEGCLLATAAAFNRAVLPFERIKAVCYFKSMPRTSLGKVLQCELNPYFADRLYNCSIENKEQTNYNC